MSPTRISHLSFHVSSPVEGLLTIYFCCRTVFFVGCYYFYHPIPVRFTETTNCPMGKKGVDSKEDTKRIGPYYVISG